MWASPLTFVVIWLACGLVVVVDRHAQLKDAYERANNLMLRADWVVMDIYMNGGTSEIVGEAASKYFDRSTWTGDRSLAKKLNAFVDTICDDQHMTTEARERACPVLGHLPFHWQAASFAIDKFVLGVRWTERADQIVREFGKYVTDRLG